MLNVKQIKDFEGLYTISSCGKVFNRAKQMKTYFTKTGYECIKLHDKTGKRFNKTIHRLVAETFIPNPLNKSEVNHIDGDKSNNDITNLEWVTSSENKRHARTTGLNPYNYPTKGKKFGKSSRFRNVIWVESRRKWQASISYQNKSVGLARFDDEVSAALHVNYLIDLYKLDRPKNIV